MTPVASKHHAGFLNLENISRLAWMVWRRDLDVFLKTYKTAMIPPFLEPVLYLFAFGFGLGAIVKGNVEGMSYIQFIAPAMIALAVMNGAGFECTYGSFVRMYYQKTFDAIIATPASVEDVVAGEMLWGATKSMLHAGIMVVIMIIIGPILGIQLLSPWHAALIIPAAFLGGMAFATIAMCFTAIVPMIDHFNYYVTFIMTPMMLLCGTFFPLSALPGALQTIARFLPLTHVVITIRQLAMGTVTIASVYSSIILAALAASVFVIAVNLMKRRLIK